MLLLCGHPLRAVSQTVLHSDATAATEGPDEEAEPGPAGAQPPGLRFAAIELFSLSQQALRSTLVSACVFVPSNPHV